MPTGIYKRDKGKKYGMTGKKHTAETKKKISINKKGKIFHWKGGRTIDSNGYVWVYKPEHLNSIHGTYIAEHRLIMEQKIGRYLESNEEVHHINGDKQDNRIENLILFNNKSEHRKQDWADGTTKGRSKR